VAAKLYHLSHLATTHVLPLVLDCSIDVSKAARERFSGYLVCRTALSLFWIPHSYRECTIGGFVESYVY
jgi:hypothetical protein